MLAVYADWWGCGRYEFVEAMLTIAPPPPWVEHLTDLVLHAEEDRLEVDGDDAVERVLLDVRQALLLELDGGSVHGAVQPAERLDRAGHERLDRLRVGDVGGDEARLAAGAGDQLGGLLPGLGGDVGDGDLGSGFGERDRDRPPHPAGARR